MINLNQLYGFYVTAREGSLKSASLALNITQPALSTQIKNLEVSLGIRLFDRKQRGLRLNDTGRLVYHQCAKIFDLVSDLESSLQGVSREVPLVRVGVVPSVANDFVKQVVLKIWNSGSRVQVKITNVDHLFQLMDESRLDMAITDFRPKRWSERWKIMKLTDRRMLVVGHPKFKKWAHHFPRGLNGAPFIHFTHDNSLRAEVDKYFLRHKVRVNTVGECDDFDLSKEFCVEGRGICIISERAIHSYVSSHDVIVFGELSHLSTSLWLICDVEKKEILARLESGRGI